MNITKRIIKFSSLIVSRRDDRESLSGLSCLYMSPIPQNHTINIANSTFTGWCSITGQVSLETREKRFVHVR